MLSPVPWIPVRLPRRGSRQSLLRLLPAFRPFLETQRRPIRKDQSLPIDEHALLPVGRVGVVEFDVARPLRDEQVPPITVSKIVLADLPDSLTRQIRVDPGDRDCRDRRAEDARETRESRPVRRVSGILPSLLKIRIVRGKPSA